MIEKTESVEFVRERERERELYSKEIGFICNAINELNENIRKRIDYKAKVKNRKIKLLRDSLSFL